MKKSSKIYLLTVALWIPLSLFATPQLYSSLNSDAPPTMSLFWIFSICMLNYFWLFSCYHAVSFFFSYSTSRVFSNFSKITDFPHIAVLYTTRNDFVERCAETCIKLDYPSCHLFICDDSDDDRFKNRIEAFWAANSRQCTIIRRENKSGFKAGNLNNALHKLDPMYKYIIVADYDSMIPSSFIRKTLQYFETYPRLAFVQAVHRGEVCYPSWFSLDLLPGVDCLWQYMSLKNRYGLVPCFGHGVMLCRSILVKVGGFPQILSEDLALTTILREAGYYGVVADNIVCGEGIPLTLKQFRRRYEKWLVGMAEFSKTYLPQFLRSKTTTVIEKFDLVFHCLNLVNVIPLLIFIVGINVFVPLFYGQTERMTVGLRSYDAEWQFNVISIRHFMDSTDSTFLRILVVTTILAPLLYFSSLFLAQPIRTMRHVAISFSCFCSIIIPSIISMLMFFLSGVSCYRPTGDFKEDKLWVPGGLSAWRQNLYVGRGFSLLIETVFCLGLLVCALRTANVFLLSFAIGASIGPIYTFFDWDEMSLAFLKYLPFCLLLLQLVMISMPIIGYTGIFSHLVVIHF